MKKIVYLAPALLLGLVGNGVMADQNMHISHLDASFMTSLSESQPDQAANANRPVQEQAAQSKDAKTNETKKATTHISSLDSNYVIYFQLKS